MEETKTMKFSVENALRGTDQLCFRSKNMSLLECRMVRWIVCNNLTTHPDYVASRGVSPFLQGYREPHLKENDGRVLVEFWSDDVDKINSYVDYVNAQMNDHERILIMQEMLEV